MDYIIQFVGIILIVGSSTTGTPYRALVPDWDPADRFCAGQMKNAPEHEVYLRISDCDLSPDTSWPAAERKRCEPLERCTLFRIDRASTITIDSGFSSGTAVHEQASFCLVPDVKKEGNNQPTSVNENGALVKMDLPGGTLSAEQLENGAVIGRLLVPAGEAGARDPQSIVVTVTDGTGSRKVVVHPGATITLLSATPEMAVKDFEADDVHISSQHPHNFLFNKVLTTATACKPWDEKRPCGPQVRQRIPSAGTVAELVCSIGKIKP